MNTLEKIKDFGAIDAENDDRLIEYFYKTPIIQNLYNYEKSIIIGRKGTGKTAIYRYINEDKQENTVTLLFKDYPWKTHDYFKNNIVSERESFVYSWEFLFYIEIFKQIVKKKESVKAKTIRKSIKKIEVWLKKNWGYISFDHKETLTPKEARFKWIFEPQIFGNSLGSVQKAIESQENPGQTLSEFNKKFEKILKAILKEYSDEIILLFDELDLAYTSDDINYRNRLIGLLLAAYSFFPKFDKKIKIYLFLRSDIFNMLEFQDKNKIKDNMVDFLDWDPERFDTKLSLKQVMSIRIKSNTDQTSDNFLRNWNHIFDENNIGRNKTKWNFITDRTFLRPRDFIKFLNLSLEQAKIRLRNNPETIDKIVNEDIHAIRKQYSQYLYEELKDEMM